MSQSAPIDLGFLADRLRAMGYDIEPESPGRPAGSATMARRERGERTVLLVIDRVGRVRVDLAWVVGEWSARVTLGETVLHSVDRVMREVSLTGQVATTEQAIAVVAGLGGIEPWAAPDGGAAPAPDESPPPW